MGIFNYWPAFIQTKPFNHHLHFKPSIMSDRNLRYPLDLLTPAAHQKGQIQMLSPPYPPPPCLTEISSFIDLQFSRQRLMSDTPGCWIGPVVVRCRLHYQITCQSQSKDLICPLSYDGSNTRAIAWLFLVWYAWKKDLLCHYGGIPSPEFLI
jgi:hypothetical protein